MNMNKEPFAAAHPFLICIDSDGCVFDTMEIKHKECFCPATVEHFHLQPVSRYARDAWDFVNLYSCFRGIHRLRALLKVLELLACRREVRGARLRTARAAHAAPLCAGGASPEQRRPSGVSGGASAGGGYPPHARMVCGCERTHRPDGARDSALSARAGKPAGGPGSTPIS